MLGDDMLYAELAASLDATMILPTIGSIVLLVVMLVISTRVPKEWHKDDLGDDLSTRELRAIARAAQRSKE